MGMYTTTGAQSIPVLKLKWIFPIKVRPKLLGTLKREDLTLPKYNQGTHSFMNIKLKTVQSMRITQFTIPFDLYVILG